MTAHLPMTGPGWTQRYRLSLGSGSLDVASGSTTPAAVIEAATLDTTLDPEESGAMTLSTHSGDGSIQKSAEGNTYRY